MLLQSSGRSHPRPRGFMEGAAYSPQAPFFYFAQGSGGYGQPYPGPPGYHPFRTSMPPPHLMGHFPVSESPAQAAEPIKSCLFEALQQRFAGRRVFLSISHAAKGTELLFFFRKMPKSCQLNFLIHRGRSYTVQEMLCCEAAQYETWHCRSLRVTMANLNTICDIKCHSSGIKALLISTIHPHPMALLPPKL